jgi:proline dehydrogenase
MVAVDYNALFRKGILAASQNRWGQALMRRYGMRLGAARFVAGETLDACVSILRTLNDQGLYTNTTLLGEHVADETAIGAVTASYLAILDRIAAEGLKTNIALKLTHLGLDFGVPVALEQLSTIVSHARIKGNFVRIDMEASDRVDATLAIYRALRAKGFDNVGTVLQAYLYRSEADLRSLLPLNPNLRLVKGAYLEPATVAFADKAAVDKNFVKLIELSLRGEGYTAVATHDERVIDHTIAFAKQHGVANDRFEFQMLYGVRPEYQRQLVSQGYKVLIATPYGPDWYPYLMRRLAERPANLLFMLRNLLRR